MGEKKVSFEKCFTIIELDVKSGRVQKRFWCGKTIHPWMLPLGVIALHLPHLRTTRDLAYLHLPSGIPFSSYSSFLILFLFSFFQSGKAFTFPLHHSVYLTISTLRTWILINIEVRKFSNSFYSPSILITSLFFPPVAPQCKSNMLWILKKH